MSPDMSGVKSVAAGIGNGASKAVDSKAFHTDKTIT